MAKYVLMRACDCGMKNCRRSVHVIGDPGREKVHLVLKDDDKLVGAIRLTKEACQELGRWLLDEPAPIKLGQARKHRRHGVLPWEC